jgi:hypothetical protein
MNSVRDHLKNGKTTTATEAAEALAADEKWAQIMGGLDQPRRCKLRKQIAQEFSEEVASVLLPMRKVGRPVVYVGPWSSLSGPVRAAIDAAKILRVPLTETGAEDWTPEAVSAAADVIANHYSRSPSSGAMGISWLRSGLIAIGVAPEAIRASARPELTRAHNLKIQAARSERVAEGFEAPPEFMRVADLTERVRKYLAADDPPDGQTAADLLVALSARPGEAETLVIGEHGGVRGSLKKRGAESEMPLVSSLGYDLAVSFLGKWKAASSQDRRRAMRDLSALVRKWGIQKRDLRAVGAMLAIRSAQLAGAVENQGQAREVHRTALRHAEPAAAAAQDHYARVNDPTSVVCAKVSELSLSDRELVERFISALAAQGGPRV